MLKIYTKLFTLLFVIFAFSFTAQAQSTTVEEWFVADKQVDCTGVAPQKCLVVRKTDTPDWKYFYSPIKGFKFQDGVTQKIQVRIRRKPVPTDLTALEFKQIKIVSQSKTNGNTIEEALAQMKNKNNSSALVSQKWTLIEADGAKVEGDYFIEFDGKLNRFSGRVCNRLTGSYEMAGSSLKFSRVASTRMACEPAKMQLEAQVINLLEQDSRYELTDDSLSLYQGGKPVLKFAASNGSSISSEFENNKWLLKVVNGNALPKMKREPFLVFNKKDNTAGGDSGCNSFGGNYTVEGNKISFKNIVGTLIGCSAFTNEIERGFLTGLEKANRFEVKNGELNIYEGDKFLLKFIASKKD